MELGRLFVTIAADTKKLTAGLAKAKGEIAKTTAGMGAQFKTMGLGMVVAGTAITAAFGYATKGSMDLEAKLKRIEIQSGATASEMAEIKKTALSEEFIKLGKSGSQIADMYNRLASEGYNVIEMKKMLKPITEAAIVLGTEEGATTKLMLNLMQQYNLTANDMGHISDVLAGALANTSFQGQELADVMKYAGVAAGELGWSLEGTIPIVDAIIKVTGEASMAGTQFRMMIQKLRDPTEEMIGEFAKIGITMEEVAEAIKTPIGLVNLLNKAHEEGANFAGMFGARAGSAAAVIARQSVPAIEALTEKVNETGFSHKAAGEIMDTTTGKFATFGAAMQNIRTIIGDALLPIVSKLAEWIGKVAIAMKKFMDAHPGLTKAITILGAALGVLVGAGGAIILGIIAFQKFIAVKTALLLFSGPIGWLIAGVIALTIAWVTNFGKIRDFTLAMVEPIKKAIGFIIDKFIWVLEKLGLMEKKVGEAAVFSAEATGALAEAYAKIEDKSKGATEGTDELGDEIDELGDSAKEAGEKLDEFGNKIETFDEWVERLNEEAKTLAEATEGVRDKILELSSPMEYQIKLLEEEAEALREMGVEESLVVEWLEKAKIKLNENSEATKKLSEAKKKLADMTKSLTDKIYEFTHTEEEIKLRDINREYDLLIENAKEVYKGQKELTEVIGIINEKRQEEIDVLKESNEVKDEAMDKNEELVDSIEEVIEATEEAGEVTKGAGILGGKGWDEFTASINRARISLSNFTKEGLAAMIATIKMKFFPVLQDLYASLETAGQYAFLVQGQISNVLAMQAQQIATAMFGCRHNR
jgi:TP901 family phage tail tape measure protein